MKIILTNKTRGTRFTIIDKKTLRALEILPGASIEVVVDSEEDIKQYRRSYEGVGIDISIKENPVEVIPLTQAEPEKPKRSRKKSTKTSEETPAE